MLGAIVQARMTSKRFPGKVLYKVRNKPLLQYLLESLAQCELLDKVVVATSVDPSDNPIVEYCHENGALYYRGHLNDVAGRFVEVIDAFNLDAFVRICGDSPLIDHRLIDQFIHVFNNNDFDMVTNRLKRTFPKGQTVEILKSSVFKITYSLMRKQSEYEHVTSYFYTHHKDFSIKNIESNGDYGDITLSVDEPNDMERFKELIDSMEKPHVEFSFIDIISKLHGHIEKL